MLNQTFRFPTKKWLAIAINKGLFDGTSRLMSLAKNELSDISQTSFVFSSTFEFVGVVHTHREVGIGLC